MTQFSIKDLVNHKLINMKRINVILFAGLALMSISCKKYLDINKNPNAATAATPELVLPQAITTTAGVLNGYNSYGAQLGGYSANAGGYGGFGTSISYNFAASDYNGLWSSTYDNLEDYQYIINYSKGNPLYNYYSGAAQVMRVLGFEHLVDAYNDVPYTDALQGANILTPTYSSAKTIYASLATELDSAIAKFNVGATVAGEIPLSTNDVMFGGNTTKWKQFANTLKLRLLVRGKGLVTFANTTITSDGYLTADALINPGYVRDNGRQNPKWNNWAFGYTGSDANKAWMPSKYIFAFYDGTKISDPTRGAGMYYKFPNTGTNRLGIENSSLVSCPSGSFWYPGSVRAGASAGNATGALKGPTVGYPVITAAEAYFLRAEAGLVGITSDDPATMFGNGVTAAFTYTLTLENGTLSTPVGAAVTNYYTANPSTPLVNFSLALTTAQKLEAIITQKYIALNEVNSEEGWNEYRRTGYPVVIPTGSNYQTFASTVSESSRADKLPSRILYPSAEGSYNSTNVPKGISPFTSNIFWAK